uniref:ADF-H domain-containing protein n=1 Tax=Alexandrium monilatum TaxID=311494 RepID=A0A6T1J6X8_9DINO
MSGVAVADECTEKYNQIKMKKDLRYVTFKIEQYKQIVVEHEGPVSESYKDFVAKLPEAEPRYALVDIDYMTDDGRPQSKLCFIFWSPDDKTKVKDRMVYASSQDAIKKKFTGVMKAIQANDMSDLDEQEVHKEMNKK